MSKLNPKKTLALFFALLALGGIMETIDVYYDPRYSHSSAILIATGTVTVAFIILAVFFWRAGASQKMK